MTNTTGTARQTTHRQEQHAAFWPAIGEVVGWLNSHNGDGPQEQTLRVMKVGEECGEVLGAWIGMTGQNPRKGAYASKDDVQSELCDVIVAAAVALATLTGDPAAAGDILTARVDHVLDRIGD